VALGLQGVVNANKERAAAEAAKDVVQLRAERYLAYLEPEIAKLSSSSVGASPSRRAFGFATQPTPGPGPVRGLAFRCPAVRWTPGTGGHSLHFASDTWEIGANPNNGRPAGSPVIVDGLRRLTSFVGGARP